MDLRHDFGERVRRRRMELGISQAAFSTAVGIPVPRLSSIEHGHQSIYIERLVDLAKALQVSTDYLLGLVEDPTPAAARPRQPLPAEASASQALDATAPPPKRRRPRQGTPVA
jgi:transcriptional regulator with XRE-family HTH domain